MPVTSVKLEAEMVGDALRIIKTVVVWPDGETVRATAAQLKGRINPGPLFAFFAAYKLHLTSGITDQAFDVAGPTGSYVASLHHLLENCKKKGNFWLFKVFGSRKNSPGECRILELIEAPERQGSFVARLCNGNELPTVELIVNRKMLESPDELTSLFLRLGANFPDSGLPESEQSEIPLYWGYRPAAHDDIRQTLLACQEQLVIAGIALTTVTGILNDPQVVETLIPRLSRGSLSIICIVLGDANHPRSLEDGGGELRERLKLGRNALRRFYETSLRSGDSVAALSGDAFQVRTYADGLLPRHFILKSDDTIYFGSYLSHEPGASSYLLKLRDAGQGLYNLLSKELDHIVRNSVEYTDYRSFESKPMEND